MRLPARGTHSQSRFHVHVIGCEPTPPIVTVNSSIDSNLGNPNWPMGQPSSLQAIAKNTHESPALRLRLSSLRPLAFSNAPCSIEPTTDRDMFSRSFEWNGDGSDFQKIVGKEV